MKEIACSCSLNRIDMPKRRVQTTSFDLLFQTSFNRPRETIRKSYSIFHDEQRIPLVIQIFFWRQSK